MSTFLNYARDFVDIPYDYWLARFPITNEQYETFAQTQSKNPVSWLKHKRNHPVVNVSWHDAMAYCQWLNDLLREKLPDDLILCLPTEANWEKAARGTDGRIYP
jgi:formylglycine-generating enzyme required for sulfatase activity